MATKKKKEPPVETAWDLATRPYESLNKRQKKIVQDGAAEGLRRIDPHLARLLDAFIEIGKTDFYEEAAKLEAQNDAQFEQMARYYDAERERIKAMRARGEKFPQSLDRKRNRFNLGHDELDNPQAVAAKPEVVENNNKQESKPKERARTRQKAS